MTRPCGSALCPYLQPVDVTEPVNLPHPCKKYIGSCPPTMATDPWKTLPTAASTCYLQTTHLQVVLHGLLWDEDCSFLAAQAGAQG